MEYSEYDVDIKELTFDVTNKVRRYMKGLIEHEGSDLHIKANAPVRARINGEIVTVTKEKMTKEESLTLAKEMLRGRFREFVENKEIDFLYVYDEKTRFRGNMFFQMDGVSAVFRIIPVDIMTIDELELPSALHKLTDISRGLVLVTGVTGSGKSTTLAALIDEINKKHRKHIITIEDPIEFVHKDRKCLINQRSVGQDSLSFANALRSALREDPDIILVGEMRDVETIDTALHAAETGHLVFSTLHTLDAKETINRVISVFPAEDQNRVRNTLASVLEGVLSQRLVKTVDGNKTAAVEILFNTSYIQKLILEGRDLEIKDALDEGTQIYGTQSFDTALLKLYKKGKITMEEALRNASSPNDLKLRIEGMQSDVEHGQSREGVFISEHDSDIFGLKED
ncbi:type IV pilus twitching motility protein PilT [Hydrogenimonas cancrithermarum]|uniref:Twitching motility protein n=1 Tax=Hydrogenimonas cancrithermarum TaxID=2993563 RepID=A0ABM8FJV9_9BACT|nr:PilT/PilU family type 4a pilus ATPase [Hydrogenimonas cancrithermarum]BDY12589.1 twitching motility protein [Hydrogenimonas cancrithermarum]